VRRKPYNVVIVVIFALWSMYGYFTKFYGNARPGKVHERRRSASAPPKKSGCHGPGLNPRE
jgi:hypothetical protein